MSAEDFLLRSLLLGNGLSGLDWLTLLALVAVGLFYFLAPVLGYRGPRGLLLSALWVLVAKMGLGVLRMCLLFIRMVDKGSMSGPSSGKSVEQEALWMLALLFESGLFVLGMILFVSGLTALRRDPGGPPFRRFPEE